MIKFSDQKCVKDCVFMDRNPDSPTCEIVTIGTELLLGQIMDTNTTYLAQKLGRIGVTTHYRTAVGDREEEIIGVLRHAVGRCDLVITTGGLGPTLDDLTREAVARLGKVELEFRQDLMDQIEEMFGRAGYRMSENNRKQAYVPAGSMAIPNPVGTAPGFIEEVDGVPVICLPGVPRELEYLLEKEVFPWLQGRFKLSGHRVTYRVLKVVGIGESNLDRCIGDLMGEGKNPEIGLLSSPGEIKIRITATAKGEQEAEALIQPIEMEIRARLGAKVYGEDGDTLEGVIDSLLARKALNLAVLETFSGGLGALRLNKLPSNRLLYSQVIGEKGHLIEWLGETEKLGGGGERAHASARKIREIGKAEVGLAIVGFLDRGEERGAMKGFAAASGEGFEREFSWQMGGDFHTLQERGAVIGLNTLRLALVGKSNG